MSLPRRLGLWSAAGVVVAFFITELAISLSSTGIPNSGGGHGYRALPLYLAAGIPIEGIIILEAVETIPDIFDAPLRWSGQVQRGRARGPFRRTALRSTGARGTIGLDSHLPRGRFALDSRSLSLAGAHGPAESARPRRPGPCRRSIAPPSP